MNDNLYYFVLPVSEPVPVGGEGLCVENEGPSRAQSPEPLEQHVCVVREIQLHGVGSALGQHADLDGRSAPRGAADGRHLGDPLQNSAHLALEVGLGSEDVLGVNVEANQDLDVTSFRFNSAQLPLDFIVQSFQDLLVQLRQL